MTTHSPTPKMTYQDLQLLPDDLLRHELIDGEHYMNPAPALKHQRVVLNLGASILRFVRRRRLGEVFVAPVDVLFSQFDVVEPDILFVSRERADRLQERHVAGAPDLVVEVLSPSTRGLDRVKKLRLYEKNGGREYWLADPVLETIEIFRATPDGRFVRVALLTRAAGDILETPLLPGLRIPLSELFD